MNKHVRNIIVIAIAIKLAYLLFTYAEYNFNRNALSEQFNPIQNSFYNNDAGWYVSIAKTWYPKISEEKYLGCCKSDCFHQSKYGFFPGFPAVIRIAYKITGAPIIPLSIILAQILSISAFLMFYFFASAHFGCKNKAYSSAILLMVFPFHYFFSMVYTESLFLLLLLLSFYGVKMNRYRITSLVFAFLAITRPNGIILGLPLLIYVYEQKFKGLESSLFSLNTIKLLLSKQWIWIPTILVFLAYCYFQWVQTDFFFAFIKAQNGWCKQKMFPFKALFSTGELYVQVNSIYTVCFLLLVITSIWIKKWSLSFYVLTLTNILLPLYYGSALAMPRYISVMFPCFLFLGFLIHKCRHKQIIFVVFFLLQLVTYHFWVAAPNYLGY